MLNVGRILRDHRHWGVGFSPPDSWRLWRPRCRSPATEEEVLRDRVVSRSGACPALPCEVVSMASGHVRLACVVKTFVTNIDVCDLKTQDCGCDVVVAGQRSREEKKPIVA